MLRLTTFGGLALSRDGTPLTGAAAQRSRLSLLALLATAGPTGFSRDKLLLHLWPESDEERARHALKQAVYSLRRELGAEDVIVGTASLSLNPLIITSDVRDFETAIAAGDYAAAAALYTGPFLDGVHLKDSAEYDRWSSEQRAKYAHMWSSAVERLATDCEANGAWREAGGHWRALTSAEPLSGRLTLALIRCLAESGDLGAALQQFKIHETLLKEELGTSPEPQVAAFAEKLRAGTWTRSPERAPVRMAPPTPAPGSAAPVVGVAAATPIAEVAPSAPPAGALEVRVTPGSGRIGITPARRRRRRSAALWFVLGMVLVLTAALSMTYASMGPRTRSLLSALRNRPDAVLAEKRIVVAPFENATTEPALALLGEHIAEYFAQQLGEAGFETVPAQTVRIDRKVLDSIPRFLRNDDADLALAEESGSRFLVTGRLYQGTGNSLDAFVYVRDVATGRELETLGPFHGSPQEPEKFILTLLQPTITSLHKRVDTTAGGLTISYTLPASIEAFERVSRAWERFFENSRDTISVFAMLDTAIRLDSTYAAPYLAKGYIRDVKSQWGGVDEVVRKVRQINPKMSKLERTALELFEADLRGQPLTRLVLSKRLMELSPGSSEMPLLVVMSAMYVGRTAEALAAHKAAVPDRGFNFGAPPYLEWTTEVHHALGDTAAEMVAARKLSQRFPLNPMSTLNLVRALAGTNHPDLGKVVDAGMRTSPSERRDTVADRRNMMLLAGWELRAHGHEAEAASYFKRLLDQVATLPPNATLTQLRHRANALYETGDWARAQAAFDAVVRADSNDIESEGRQATSAVRAGDIETAKKIDAHLAAMNRRFMMGLNLRWRANIAAVQNREADAIALLESAVRAGHRLLDSPMHLIVHYDRDFQAIQASPAYKLMLKSLQETPLR